MKRALIAIAVLALLALAGLAVTATVTSAQEGDGPIGSLLARVAQKLGVSQDELETAIRDARIEMIDEAVADGRLTAEQAERLKARVEEDGFLLPRGLGHGPPLIAAYHNPRGPLAGAVAETLGLSRAELMRQLRDCNTLADIAAAQGLSRDELKAALLDQARARLDNSGLGQQRADLILQRLQSALDRALDAGVDQHPLCRTDTGRGPSSGQMDEESVD